MKMSGGGIERRREGSGYSEEKNLQAVAQNISSRYILYRRKQKGVVLPVSLLGHNPAVGSATPERRSPMNGNVTLIIIDGTDATKRTRQ